MSKKMLTFEINEDGESIEIHGDSAGLTDLVKSLQTLLFAGKQDHIHLMTPAWGGDELTEDVQGINNKLVKGVKVLFWKE